MDNNKNTENKATIKNVNFYSNAPGTGVLASMIFVIAVFLGMLLLSKFIGQ